MFTESSRCRAQGAVTHEPSDVVEVKSSRERTLAVTRPPHMDTQCRLPIRLAVRTAIGTSVSVEGTDKSHLHRKIGSWSIRRDCQLNQGMAGVQQFLREFDEDVGALTRSG